MNEPARPAPPQTSSEPSTVEELRADIDKTRPAPAVPVNAVSSRPKVPAPARASQKMHEAKSHAGHTLTRAGDAVGRAKQKAPQPVQKAVDATGEKPSPLLHQSSAKLARRVGQSTDKIKRYRKQLLGAGAALLAARFAARRRSSKDHSS
jgi:hypothetical protein